jgi:hypothetical protein
VFAADTSIFVDTAGSATNDALTSSTPLLDPSFAYAMVQSSFDINGKVITFSFATGRPPKSGH